MSKSGQLLVQNIQLMLGLLYHVSISHQGGDHLCRECRLLEHDLILTRDRNKEFHIFQHTTRHSGLSSAASPASLERHEVVFENCTCSLLPPRMQNLMSNGEGGVASSQQDTPFWTDESHHAYGSNLNFYSPLHIAQKHEGGHCTITSESSGGCHFQKLRQLHLLRVATYNIWNVNSLSDAKESYENRIARLGKVS